MGLFALVPLALSTIQIETFSGNVDCGTIPDVAALTSTGTFTASTMDFDGGDENKPTLWGSFETGSNWAAKLSTTLSVANAGAYTFKVALGNADTVNVVVDGVEVLASDCSWAYTMEGVGVALSSGAHSVVVTYADDGWTDKLQVQIKGPDTAGVYVSFPPPAVAEVEDEAELEDQDDEDEGDPVEPPEQQVSGVSADCVDDSSRADCDALGGPTACHSFTFEDTGSRAAHDTRAKCARMCRTCRPEQPRIGTYVWRARPH